MPCAKAPSLGMEQLSDLDEGSISRKGSQDVATGRLES